jgi:cell division protein FtsL
MRRSDFALFVCLIICAIAVVHTQHRAIRVFVDLEREKTRGDELAADLRRLQAQRATLVASNRVEHVASEMKMLLPDTHTVIVMGNQRQDLADLSSAAQSLAFAEAVSVRPIESLAKPRSLMSAEKNPKTKQPTHLAKGAR